MSGPTERRQIQKHPHPVAASSQELGEVRGARILSREGYTAGWVLGASCSPASQPPGHLGTADQQKYTHEQHHSMTSNYSVNSTLKQLFF